MSNVYPFTLMEDDEDALDIEAVALMEDEGGRDILTEDELGVAESWETSPQPDAGDFNANLAEFIEDKQFLAKLGQQVCEWADEDEQNRQDWRKREAKAIDLLGISEEAEGGADFEGASRVVHPLMGIGCIQFQARAIAELWPPGGPVKSVVIGESDEEAQEQAERVAKYMNYQYTELMPGAFEELDRLLMRLPISGSCFKRVYYDPLEETVVARFVEPTKVYVPYAATDMASVPHFEYEFEETERDTQALMLSGHYLDIDLSQPGDEGEERNEVQEKIDTVEGTAPVTTYDDNASYTRYEAACFLDVPGLEERLPLPYLVTVDKDAQVVLRIQRNWSPVDEKKKRRVHLVHYYFMPGLGFYGYGYAHWLAGLSSAMTGAVRAILDSAYVNNVQGGFVTRDARLAKSKHKGQMGKWTEVDVDAETLRNAFHPFVTKEPSRTLVEMLQYLEEVGRLLNSTTENVVGDAANTGPVGTTLALLDQQLKVFSAVHKRLHQAQGREFRLVAELNAETLPANEGYPFATEGDEQTVMAADFDERVDVVPVSDPNIVTQTQRIAQAQSVRQLASEAPDLYNRRLVEKATLESLRVPNADELLPDEAQVPRRDPVSENAQAIQGNAIQVYPDQDHESHIAVHHALMQGLDGEILERAQPILEEHIAAHYAMMYKQAISAQMGIDLPADGEPLDPEADMILAQAAAEIHMRALPEEPPPGEMVDPVQQAKIDAAQAEMDRKDALAASEISRKQQKQDAEEEIAFARESAKIQQAIDQSEYGAPAAPKARRQGGLDSV